MVTIGDQVWMVENIKYLPTVVGPATGSEIDPYNYAYGYDGTDVKVFKLVSQHSLDTCACREIK